MSDKNPATQFDFSKSLMSARQLPVAVDGTPGQLSEFPPQFGPTPEENIDDQKAAPQLFEGDLAPDLGVQIFSQVFVLWRPWEKCKRCAVAIEDQKIVLPEESDYTCPHTHRRAYKERMDACLKGAGAVTLREFYTLPNGTRCVHVEWYEHDPEALARQKRKAEEAKKNSLAPTFGVGDTAKAPVRS